MSARITFVTGGARSGKSTYVIETVSAMQGAKAYIATAEALDEEMKDRIQRHRNDRGEEWSNFEEPIRIAGLIADISSRYDIVVLDCLTLWLSNIMLKPDDTGEEKPASAVSGRGSEHAQESIIELVHALMQCKNAAHRKQQATEMFIVSNEVGMGIVPDNPLARGFRDLAGYLNQKIAAIADEAYLVTAGIPMKIK